jgi:hypothetical protein
MSELFIQLLQRRKSRCQFRDELHRIRHKGNLQYPIQYLSQVSPSMWCRKEYDGRGGLDNVLILGVVQTLHICLNGD